MKKPLFCYFLLLISIKVGLAEQAVYISGGSIYSVDLKNNRAKLIVEPGFQEKIISLLVLPGSGLLIYARQGKSGSSIWQSPLEGPDEKELLKTEFSQIELGDYSPDEKRIVFQAKRADSFSVFYLNRQSGKLLQLPAAFSPRFLTNTKILVLAQPSWPGFCYHLLACWDVAEEKLDTLAYTPETCNRVLSISNNRNLLALIRSDAGTQMNEYIDVADAAGQVTISKAAISTGLIRILGGPEFSPGNKHIAWVAEHWLMLTDLQTRETKRIARRLMTDDLAWSPYGGEILFAFKPPRNPKECPTCPKSMLKHLPGLFTVDLSGEIFERVAYASRVEKRIFWIK